MSEVPSVGRPAYWAAYRALVREEWSSWRKLWIRAQASFLLAFAAHYLWLKEKTGALDSLEGHVIYAVLPLLFGLLWLFVFNLFVAAIRMAQNIENERDRRIEKLRAMVAESGTTIKALNRQIAALRNEERHELERKRALEQLKLKYGELASLMEKAKALRRTMDTHPPHGALKMGDLSMRTATIEDMRELGPAQSYDRELWDWWQRVVNETAHTGYEDLLPKIHRAPMDSVREVEQVQWLADRIENLSDVLAKMKDRWDD